MSVSRRISSVVFDIEGTTTPITFVSNVLFPFVRENLCGFFESTWPSEQTQADVSLLYQTNQQDLKGLSLSLSPSTLDLSLIHFP